MLTEAETKIAAEAIGLVRSETFYNYQNSRSDDDKQELDRANLVYQAFDYILERGNPSEIINLINEGRVRAQDAVETINLAPTLVEMLRSEVPPRDVEQTVDHDEGSVQEQEDHARIRHRLYP